MIETKNIKAKDYKEITIKEITKGASRKLEALLFEKRRINRLLLIE